jgi:hypothetical protein
MMTPDSMIMAASAGEVGDDAEQREETGAGDETTGKEVQRELVHVWLL